VGLAATKPACAGFTSAAHSLDVHAGGHCGGTPSGANSFAGHARWRDI